MHQSKLIFFVCTILFIINSKQLLSQTKSVVIPISININYDYSYWKTNYQNDYLIDLTQSRYFNLGISKYHAFKPRLFGTLGLSYTMSGFKGWHFNELVVNDNGGLIEESIITDIEHIKTHRTSLETGITLKRDMVLFNAKLLFSYLLYANNKTTTNEYFPLTEPYVRYKKDQKDNVTKEFNRLWLELDLSIDRKLYKNVYLHLGVYGTFKSQYKRHRNIMNIVGGQIGINYIVL